MSHAVHELRRRNQCRWSWRRPRRQLCNMEAAADAGPSIVATPVVASPLADAHGDEIDIEESYTTPTKRAKTIMGLEICVLEARDDVYGPTTSVANIRRTSTFTSYPSQRHAILRHCDDGKTTELRKSPDTRDRNPHSTRTFREVLNSRYSGTVSSAHPEIAPCVLVGGAIREEASSDLLRDPSFSSSWSLINPADSF